MAVLIPLIVLIVVALALSGLIASLFFRALTGQRQTATARQGEKVRLS